MKIKPFITKGHKNSDIMGIFNLKLYKAVKKTGLTQVQISKEMGITTTRLSRAINNKSSVTKKQKTIYADYFKCEIKDIF